MTTETEQTAVAPAEDIPVAAPEAVEQETGAEDAEQEGSSTSDDDAQPKKNGIQGRISELVAKQRQAERDAEYWREVALGNVRGGQQPQPQADDDAGYVPPVDPNAIAQQVREQIVFENKRSEILAKAPESHGVTTFFTDQHLPVTKAMLDVVMASPNADKLADYIGSNRAEAARIAALPAHLAAYEMARLETSLTAAPQHKPRNVPPAPPPQVGGRASPTVDPDSLSPEEWLTWRQEQMRTR